MASENLKVLTSAHLAKACLNLEIIDFNVICKEELKLEQQGVEKNPKSGYLSNMKPKSSAVVYVNEVRYAPNIKWQWFPYTPNINTDMIAIPEE
ncbi:hypothetical protein C5167_031118 [Papaver somniferum]|nr:hypothetical protein C5167_031118 [Papaver somniferum]